jgi:hypothetical protein
MVVNEIVHVSIAPLHVLEANLVKEAAAIINKDLYSTRLLLAGKIPRVIAHYNTMAMAELTAQRLRGLGLAVVVCRDSELRKSPNAFKAHTLKIGQGQVLFWDTSGQLITMESKNTFLILSGQIQTYTNTEVTRTKMKFNLPATLLTGGIPIWRRVNEKTGETSVQTEGFVRFYDRVSSEPIAEMLQYDFDYSFLGVKIALSSRINFDALVREIREISPQAISDDRLAEFFRADVPFSTPWENVDINCKLIYLHHQAVSNPGSSV